MRTRILTILGVFFVVAVLVVAGVLYWAMSAGTAYQDKFFAAVASGKPEDVLALMHPAMRQEIDAPVLDAWMKEVNQKLGKCQGLSKADFHTEVKYENGVKVVESTGTVDFENGTAKSEITYRDDQIVKFNVTSDAIPPGWLKSLADLTLYRKRGEEFLRFALDGQPERAFAMMHPALQKKMPLETLKPSLEGMLAKTGKLQSITYDREEFQGGKDGESLTVYYKIAMQNGPVSGRVEYQFVGLKGHILAFNATQE